MMSQKRSTIAALAGLALALVIGDTASAQPPRRGFMVYSPAELASLPEVQTNLKFNADQQAKAQEIHEQLRTDRRNLFQGGGFGGDFEEMARKIQELNRDASAKLSEALEPPQRARLQEISIQANGPMSLNDPEIAKELKLADEQQAKLAEMPQKLRESIRDAMDESQTDDQRREIISDIRAKSEEEMLAVLTPEQRDQFQAMQGEPIELDLTPLRPRFGRGRN